jgi:RNA polymerase sigma-B factor
LETKLRRGEEHEVFERYRRLRRRADRDALVERFLPLAHSLARRYPAGSEREDVDQIACLALVKAVERFDPAKGTAFSSFATPTILGEIKRYFRDHGWMVRVPRDVQDRARRVERAAGRLTAELGRPPTPEELARDVGETQEAVVEALLSSTAHRPVSLDPPGTDDERPPAATVSVIEPGFARAEDRFDIDSLLGRLPDTERTVVILRFREDLLQREIAQLMGLSQMQVSRVLTRAIGSLQAAA